MHKRLVLGALLGCSLMLGGLSACGDDSGDDEGTPVVDAGGRDSGSTATGDSSTGRSDATVDAATPAADAATPAADASAAKTIVDVAVADGRFTTLAKALTDTGLLATVQGPGPFTVFAPTDAAFAKLPSGTLASLTNDQLKVILTYHVVAGQVLSSALKAGPVTTVADLSAFVSITGSTVKVNNATVTTADVEASNGVIHVIDTVLLPPNIVEAATYAGSFSTLVSAVGTAGLAGALSAPNANLTVFAPTDAAFAALPAGTVAGLSMSQLADVLKYHVVPSKVLSTALVAGPVSTLLTGKQVTISLTGGPKVNDANIIITDVKTTNGVIHAIDKVLLPPS
jgi:transforming growth factor-beta-induced protein